MSARSRPIWYLSRSTGPACRSPALARFSTRHGDRLLVRQPGSRRRREGDLLSRPAGRGRRVSRSWPGRSYEAQDGEAQREHAQADGHAECSLPHGSSLDRVPLGACVAVSNGTECLRFDGAMGRHLTTLCPLPSVPRLRMEVVRQPPCGQPTSDDPEPLHAGWIHGAAGGFPAGGRSAKMRRWVPTVVLAGWSSWRTTASGSSMWSVRSRCSQWPTSRATLHGSAWPPSAVVTW